MIKSMTGFGRSETNQKGCRVVIEARSVNNRFLEAAVRIPRRYSLFEEELKTIIRETMSRGKVDVFVNIESESGSVENVVLNMDIAKQYLDSVKQLEKETGRTIEMNAGHLLAFDDIFTKRLSEKQAEVLKTQLEKTLKAALTELNKYRVEEGKNLAEDFKMRLKKIEDAVISIEKLVKVRSAEDFENFKTRIEKVLQNFEKIDNGRLEAEVALMAERFDVSEECVRLRSHLKMFRETLKSKEAVGRRLDFILQEINREANTISSKSNNFEISHDVVVIKEEVERLKEQGRNIE